MCPFNGRNYNEINNEESNQNILDENQATTESNENILDQNQDISPITIRIEVLSNENEEETENVTAGAAENEGLAAGATENRSNASVENTATLNSRNSYSHMNGHDYDSSGTDFTNRYHLNSRRNHRMNRRYHRRHRDRQIYKNLKSIRKIMGRTFSTLRRIKSLIQQAMF